MASLPASGYETEISSNNNTAHDNGTNYTAAFGALTMLFFMWGFITNLNDILVPHLKNVFDLSFVQAALIQFAFFTAYFVMAIPAGKVIARFGYKQAIVIGLSVSALGASLFYPAAVLPSYNVFLAGLFTLASGFTLLQVAANPYISVLGKPESAASRLNLAGGFNSLGATIAPRVGGLLILSAVTLSHAQIDGLPAAEQIAYRLTEASSVKMPYLILTGLLLTLAVAFALFKLPTIKAIGDHEGEQGHLLDALKHRQLRLGAIGIFMYVGAEVTIGSFLVSYIGLPEIAGLKEASAAVYVSYYWMNAMIGRFIGAAVLQKAKISPQRLLVIFALIAAALSAAGWLGNGAWAMWALVAVNFFNSIMWPNIFTLSIRDLGKQTNHGSSILIMMIVGGAVVPLAQGKLADMLGLHTSFFLPILCYAYIVFYGWNGWKQSKNLA